MPVWVSIRGSTSKANPVDNDDMLKLLIPVTLFATFLNTSCTSDPVATRLPWVYRIDVQQGNTITRDEVNQLKPGMDKKQVLYLMGTPIMVDPFHADRWDYIYVFEPGKNSAKSSQQHATLLFENGQLKHINDNISESTSDSASAKNAATTVIVPPQNPDDIGILTRLWNTMTRQNDAE